MNHNTRTLYFRDKKIDGQILGTGQYSQHGQTVNPIKAENNSWNTRVSKISKRQIQCSQHINNIHEILQSIQEQINSSQANHQSQCLLKKADVFSVTMLTLGSVDADATSNSVLI